MSGIYEFEGLRPTIHPSAYLAPGAVVVGDVTIGAECWIGFNAVLRADYGRIEIGRGSSIQDNATLHIRRDESVIVGEFVTVGHGAVLHNCVVHDRAVIGSNATVCDYAEIGAGAVVAEGALAATRQVVAAGMIVGGVPARVLGPVEARHEERFAVVRARYAGLGARYASSLREISRARATSEEHLRLQLAERAARYAGTPLASEALAETFFAACPPLESPVLELGTGRGGLTLAAARRGLRLVSVDVSEELRPCAELALRDAGLADQVEFRRVDPMRLPFADESFSTIISMLTLHHLQHPEAVLRELHRVAQPWSALVLGDFNERGMAELDELMRRRGDRHPASGVSLDRAEEILTELGMTVFMARREVVDILIVRKRGA